MKKPKLLDMIEVGQKVYGVHWIGAFKSDCHRTEYIVTRKNNSSFYIGEDGFESRVTKSGSRVFIMYGIYEVLFHSEKAREDFLQDRDRRIERDKYIEKKITHMNEEERDLLYEFFKSEEDQKGVAI